MAAHRGHWTAGLRGTGFDVTGGEGPGGHRRKGLDCTGYITRHSRLSPMRFNARSRTLSTIPAKVLSVLSLCPSVQRVSILSWCFVLRHDCRCLIRLLFLDSFILFRIFLYFSNSDFRNCYITLSKDSYQVNISWMTVLFGNLYLTFLLQYFILDMQHIHTHTRTHINARELNEFTIRCFKNNYAIS